MRGRVAPYEVFRQRALALGGPTTFQTEFPLGKPWHFLDLIFELAVTQLATPGVGPITDGLLKWIKNISLFTPKNEYIYNQVPGRLAYLIAIDAMDNGVPRLDTVTTGAGASTQNYVCVLRIPFHDVQAFDPSDFVLDTLGYSSMTLTVQVGALGTDFYTTANTAVPSVAKLTAVLVQEETPLAVQAASQSIGAEGKAKIIKDMGKFYRTYGIATFADPNAVAQLDIPRSSDLAYDKFFVGHFEPMVSAGQAFDGISDNISTRYTDFTLQIDTGYPIKQVRSLYLLENWKAKIPAFATAFFPNTYWEQRWAPRGQKQAALYSGDKSMLRLTWNASATPPSAQSQLVIGYKGFRARVA